ncbi:MAG TPA: type IV pili twitching motility protein PilT, partial [Anaeromyxobacteraceae bacterium]|nr:type IV pili twitching motility protein PilT [Anaeromyxobacteraceae bacterium]
QTFDQSLMSLLRSNLISYEEALRQATNPDDFALRVSGVSGTSDSQWDNFEKAEPPPAASQAGARPGGPRPPPPSSLPTGRMPPSSGTPRSAAAAQPAARDDDFKIERF